MDPLTPAQVEKLSKIAARLSSPFDGEAATAARLLDREIGKARRTWAQVFDPQPDKTKPGLTGSAGGRVYFPARWKSALRELKLLTRQGKIAGREAEFILSLNEAQEPTENQNKWLRNLFRKYTGKARCPA